MKAQFDFLSKELILIDELIDNLNSLAVPAEGTFTAERRGKGTYYYFRKKSDGKKIYLGTSKSPKVKRCKQEEMQRVLLDVLKKDRKAIEYCLRNLCDSSFENLKHSLPSKYAGISAELCLDPRLKELVEWADMDYEKNMKEYPPSKNIASDGTRLRSKGETLWYNLLTASGIPFRSDCLMTFTDRNGFPVMKAPDFLIQCYDGTFIIIEHLGMLDEDYYSRDFINKAQIYHNSGYTIGSNFFITSDDIHRGTDSCAIERTIELVKQRFLDGAPAEVKLLF